MACRRLPAPRDQHLSKLLGCDTGNLGEPYPLAFSLPPHRHREWNVAARHIHGGGVADHKWQTTPIAVLLPKDVLEGGLHRCKIEKCFADTYDNQEEEPPYLPPIPVAPI
jgi:hypothetical protein